MAFSGVPPPNPPPGNPNPPRSRIGEMLDVLLHPDQIKRAMKMGLRAMSEPCGMLDCKGVSPGPACTECNEPTCLDHTYFKASSPTEPLCPNCITGAHLATLAELGLLDDEEDDEPEKPTRRAPSKTGKKGASRKK